jgi:hypothetical protein
MLPVSLDLVLPLHKVASSLSIQAGDCLIVRKGPFLFVAADAISFVCGEDDTIVY